MACPLFRTKTSPEPTIWSGDLVITLPANSLAVKTLSRGTVLTAMFDMFYNDALSTKEFEFDFANQVIYFIITDEISRNLVHIECQYLPYPGVSVDAWLCPTNYWKPLYSPDEDRRTAAHRYEIADESSDSRDEKRPYYSLRTESG